MHVRTAHVLAIMIVIYACTHSTRIGHNDSDICMYAQHTYKYAAQAAVWLYTMLITPVQGFVGLQAGGGGGTLNFTVYVDTGKLTLAGTLTITQ